MNGLTSVRGKETDAFKTLAKYVQKDDTRADAVRAILRIPAVNWPKEGPSRCSFQPARLHQKATRGGSAPATML